MPPKTTLPPELSDRDWLIEQKRAGLRNYQIAEMLGVSGRTVGNACKRLNIQYPIVFVNNPELKTFMEHEK